MYLQGGEIVNSYNYSKMQLLKTAEKGNTLKKKKRIYAEMQDGGYLLVYMT